MNCLSLIEDCTCIKVMAQQSMLLLRIRIGKKKTKSGIVQNILAKHVTVFYFSIFFRFSKHPKDEFQVYIEGKTCLLINIIYHKIIFDETEYKTSMDKNLELLTLISM